jgi:xanthine/CO dehydrogenase XdhC/CoxF family maturation factor
MSGCRGPIDQDDQVPRVFVWCIGDGIPEQVDHIEHGLEEEGVSWAVRTGFDGESVALAHEASMNSPLKIGVGVTQAGRVVVHHKQLPDDDPVFDVADTTEATARKLGSNSARLAKGTPLKPVG